jgi:hypothetical protein
MLQITNKARRLPGPVQVAPALSLPPGQVFVSADAAGTRDLPAGVKVVLATTDGGPLELLTTKASPPVSEPGTYLDASDLAKLGTATADPTLRKYGSGDTWRKIRSRAGAQLAIGAFATLATAVVGVVLALSAASPTPSVDLTTVHSVLAWTRAPLDQLSRTRSRKVDKLDAFRRAVDSRITTGENCLALLQGEQAPPAAVPGIKCTSPSTSPWSAQTVGGLITAVIALMTAILGLVGLTTKYGFQANPA